MSKTISYSQLEQTLNQLGAQMSAAEMHGFMTAMVSLGKANSEDVAWRSAVLGSLDCNDPDIKQWGVLVDINAQIAKDLAKVDCAFNMLLPNDDSELVDRLDALGFWCRGYLSGLGVVGITNEHLTNDVVKELVQDLSQIAHISIETDASEEDEENYIELVEYVRIAVQNIQAELLDTDKQRMLH